MCVPAIHTARSVGRAHAVGDEVSLEGRKEGRAFMRVYFVLSRVLARATSNEILGYEGPAEYVG